MIKRKYSVIVFDLGNVLIPFDYNILIEKFNGIEPGLGNKFIKYYRSNYSIHRDFERGFVSEKDINYTKHFINITSEREIVDYLVPDITVLIDQK